jgi:hypothetical protein
MGSDAAVTLNHNEPGNVNPSKSNVVVVYSQQQQQKRFFVGDGIRRKEERKTFMFHCCVVYFSGWLLAVRTASPDQTVVYDVLAPGGFRISPSGFIGLGLQSW